MNSHVPFNSCQVWGSPSCGCGNSGCTTCNQSNDPIVDKLIGNAYHVVRTVYCNLGNLKLIYDFLTQYGMVLGVQSEEELKALTTEATFARIYGFDNTNRRQVTDYLYVDGDRTGILPDDPNATGSWVKVATSGSDEGGTGGRVSPPYIPYIYNNGSALGGETTIPVPVSTVGVPFIIINGMTETNSLGFTYDAATLTVTLFQPLEIGDEVVLLLTGTPAVPDNPNISDWIQFNWLYNGGYAVGGEQVIAIPYTFQSVPAVYKNGLRLYAGLAERSYTMDAPNQRVLLTEPLVVNDRLIIQLGGESTVVELSDHTLQEVARTANVMDGETILSNDTTQLLNGKKVVYDVVAQKSYGLPVLPTNVYISSVSNGQLTYNPGNVTVDLVPVPNSAEALSKFLSGTTGADSVGTSITPHTVQDIIDSPSIITGRVNIRNPKWNAPRDNAEDPAAASANAIAINAMLSSGAKHVELDDKARRVNSPLLYQSSVAIHGAGRSAISLVWTGGDLPVIARPSYANKDTMGFSNVRLQDLRITDQAATRTSYYTVDLTNGNSNGLERCMIDCPGNFDGSGNRIITSDRFGAILGRARNSAVANTYAFVSHFRDSRITNGTLVMNTTDWYINSSEIWGAFRNRTLEITGGGTIDGGTQIVPGADCGIFLTSDFGYDIATLKILGVYFDGSTDSTLYTGDAIKSDGTTGLVGGRIIGCNFDLMSGRGIYLNKANYTTIQGNIFADCDGADTGLPDISIASMFGSKIDNTHYRNTIAPKTGNARVNLGKPFTLTGAVGFPISSVGGECTYSSTYQRCTVTNPQMMKSLGGSNQTSFDYGSILPSAANRYGEVILFGGRAKYSNGTTWLDLSDDLNNLATTTDLNTLNVTAKHYAADITIHTNIPATITGPAKIDVNFTSPGYLVQELKLLKASGGIYTRRLVNSVWDAWVKIA